MYGSISVSILIKYTQSEILPQATGPTDRNTYIYDLADRLNRVNPTVVSMYYYKFASWQHSCTSQSNDLCSGISRFSALAAIAYLAFIYA
jgi:hypothetical protein